MASKDSKQGHETVEKVTKKPFNKKKWREEKYSNKHKVQRWQEKRKTILTRELKKQLAKDGIANNVGGSSAHKTAKLSRLKEAQAEFEWQKEEERQEAEEARQIKAEKMKKIKEYRAKKAEKFRKLSQKTRKGQPLMKGRMELLQEKIEQMIAENKL